MTPPRFVWGGGGVGGGGERVCEWVGSPIWFPLMELEHAPQKHAFVTLALYGEAGAVFKNEETRGYPAFCKTGFGNSWRQRKLQGDTREHTTHDRPPRLRTCGSRALRVRWQVLRA